MEYTNCLSFYIHLEYWDLCNERSELNQFNIDFLLEFNSIRILAAVKTNKKQHFNYVSTVHESRQTWIPYQYTRLHITNKVII